MNTLIVKKKITKQNRKPKQNKTKQKTVYLDSEGDELTRKMFKTKHENCLKRDTHTDTQTHKHTERSKKAGHCHRGLF